MSDTRNPWTRLSTRRFYVSRYVAVEEDEVRHRSGRVHPYTALRFRIVGIAELPVDDEGCTRLEHFQVKWIRFTVENASQSKARDDSMSMESCVDAPGGARNIFRFGAARGQG